MFSRVSLLTVLVEDYDAAVEFYQKAQWKLVKDVPFGRGEEREEEEEEGGREERKENDRWIEFQVCESLASPKIALVRADKDCKQVVGKQAGSGPVAVLEIRDVMEYHKLVTGQGIAVPEPSLDHGRLGFLLTDPFGTKFYIREERK